MFTRGSSTICFYSIGQQIDIPPRTTFRPWLNCTMVPNSSLLLRGKAEYGTVKLTRMLSDIEAIVNGSPNLSNRSLRAFSFFRHARLSIGIKRGFRHCLAVDLLLKYDSQKSSRFPVCL